MAEAESISLEETNKIRISLGMKPLTADSPPAASEDQVAEKNYEEERDRQRKEVETQRIKDKIEKARNKRELNRRLKGATLGDADATSDDAKAWLKASKRREKELAEKRQRELESMDQIFQGEEYTEKDLQGLKVSHDLDAINEGQERILTLKDSRILDNEEDELFDEEMDRAEKDQKRHELTTKRRDYKGYDDEEFVGGSEFGKRSVLAKYDEDINGASETGFRLGGPSRPTKKDRRAAEVQAAAAVNKSLLSIDYAKNLEISDYLQEGEVGFKKPKTKKKRSTRKVEADPDLLPTIGSSATNGAEEDKMDIDIKPIISAPRARDLDANFVDDDELQAALGRSRRAKTAKAVKRMAPEEMARQIMEDKREVKMEPVEPDELTAAEDDGLTFDDTTEFIRNVAMQPVIIKVQTQPKREPEGAVSADSPRVKEEPEDEDEDMSEMEAGEVDEEVEMNDDEMLRAIEGVIKEAEAAVKEEEVNREIGITDEPQLQGAGLAGALSLLRQQGLVAKPDASNLERERIQTERDTWLTDHRRRLAMREMERIRSRGTGAQAASAADAREVARMYDGYKPDVNIEYHDEFGRTLTPKEAWKALSHRFHGKGSGRTKTEKRLKKIEEERKREAMASGDTPTGMNEAFQARQQKIGQAHMVLSVGQRGAVPQAADVLDRDTLAKKPKEKGKKKESSKLSHSTTNGDPHGLINVTLPTSANLPASSAHLSAEASPSPGPERFMRPAFARIGSIEPSQATPGSGGASPLVNGERTKVAFGFKRKAVDEGEGTPPSKRR